MKDPNDKIRQLKKETGSVNPTIIMNSVKNYHFEYVLPWKFKDGENHKVYTHRREHPVLKNRFEWVMSDGGLLKRKFNLKPSVLKRIDGRYMLNKSTGIYLEQSLHFSPEDFFWQAVNFSMMYDEVEDEFSGQTKQNHNNEDPEETRRTDLP